VPVLASDELGVRVGVDGDDLRMALDAVDPAVDGQLAEGAAERLVGVVVDVLVAEEDDVVLGDGRVQLVDRAVAQRLSDRRRRPLPRSPW